ncbi:helix-turn-helix transcriptional regulator [Citrobacter amalonaticus]|uniref:Helix-turn-helix transcriptional regulator n=1 Tax=Citrobacter amalonaticus TaxID=35703 RepID=A0A2S4RUD6_CITAM|nr:LuxR C-terminal-related transcriptional regulator [Citrobacter amalonaticus]POT57041.1 helix-turn-helix transcriptional regulator [Citrobacter amalonaticus]POT72670.1 helix-turn-helix transcriptional regulator [Citrobacter amalonaticus]POU63525.1 helix-turn-helix transcriptional regulator [Citrobacter amalonaticus]POV03289.1 helix-turn-helix transcriptional regulator [Citrobacter amalonaticus]
MLKILVIDRCHFTRIGIEAWLNHSELFNSTFMVAGLNNLLLAKEHISQWKPHLVIADLYGFLRDAWSLQQIAPFFMANSSGSLILLQSGGTESQPHYPVHATLSKQVTLHELALSIHDALYTSQISEAPITTTPLLTPQEENVLTLWMEGASNNAIASALGIRGKTVYTYKRNIRVKLHMDNRFSPFLAIPEQKN